MRCASRISSSLSRLPTVDAAPMTRWRAALALAAALALGGASGSGSGSDLSDLSDLSAASDGGGSTAAVFSLERDANASTSSADVLRVVAALSSGEELAIPFQALAADSWNLSSWGNVLAQLGNAVANYDLELDAVQINVRLDEPAGPSLVCVDCQRLIDSVPMAAI